MSASVSIPRLVARVRATYASCTAYQDSGVVTTISVQEKPRPMRRTAKKSFRTAFVRPDRFHFEFADQTVGPEDEWERQTILSNEHGVRSRWTIELGIKTHASIGDAVGAAAGISGGSSRNVAGLLCPDVEMIDPLTDAEHGEWLRTDVEDDNECEVLHYTHPRGGPRTLWIDARQFSIRRIDEAHVFDAAWHEAQRVRHEQLFKSDLAPEYRAMLRRRIEANSELPPLEFRTETTTRIRPVFAAPESSVFATPADWLHDVEPGSA